MEVADMLLRNLEDMGDRLLTRSDVAGLFQVSPSTVTRWAEAGMLPAVKTLGGHRRYEARAVLDLAKQLTRQGARMENAVFELPSMYADHHVLEVRRILEALPGIEDIYASSAFHTVEVTYDPAKLRKEDISARLSEAGYVGDLSVPVETGIAANVNGGQKPYFRHTAAYEQSKRAVSFEQRVGYSGRPLWPCPGFGVLERKAEED
jgi:excisionase family DNA binding protein